MGLSLVSTTPARPASFDRSKQRRNAMIGKVHVQKKQLQLADDDYRQILMQEAGKPSCADCTEAELEKVLGRFAALGAKPQLKAGARGTAQHPMARKARALWISLYHLGEVRSPNEKALEAFAKRQLKCERLVWAKQSDGFKLIEALKSMATKGGWPQVDANGNAWTVMKLKENLCEAILIKLKAKGEARPDWTLDIAAWRLCGIDTAGEGPITAEGYDAIASALGKKLRAAGGAA